MDFSKLTPEQFKVAEMVIEAAAANNIDPNLLLAQAFHESGFKHIPNKTTDAFGVMQIRPGTAEQNKLGDITDLRTNVFGGAKLMRQYLDKYKTPEAALLAYHQGPGVADEYTKSGGDLASVGPNGLDYVIKIGEAGGFGQPADAEKKETNPFADYVSEAAKLKEEEKGKPPAKKEPEATGISPETGAMIGAGLNLFGPMVTEPTISPKIDTSRALEAQLSAADKLELARRNLERAAPEGAPDLETSYRQNQQELENLKTEQRMAQERLRALPRTPPIIEPPAPSSPFPQVTREGRASGPKVEGDSGTRNWMIQEAGQKHQLPEAVLDVATGKSKDIPTGGKALIDQDLANIEKINRLGAGDYSLVTTEGGAQLQLPPTTVAERKADIARQTQASETELEQIAEQTRIQQETQNRQLEQQRAAHEADLERIRQARGELGASQNVIAEQRRTLAPIQRAVTSAESQAEMANRRFGRAQEQPGLGGRTAEILGAKSAKMGAIPRTIAGGLAGYAGVMSYQEALERAKAGDTSEAVLKALQAGSAAASIVPPVGKGLTRLRGAGLAGLAGSYGLEGLRYLSKNRPPEQ